MLGINEFSNKLQELNLEIVWDINKRILSIGNPAFANPIIWFDPYLEEYLGNINVKSINSSLFSGKQIRKSLMLVDEFMSTPLKDRGL